MEVCKDKAKAEEDVEYIQFVEKMWKGAKTSGATVENHTLPTPHSLPPPPTHPHTLPTQAYSKQAAAMAVANRRVEFRGMKAAAVDIFPWCFRQLLPEHVWPGSPV